MTVRFSAANMCSGLIGRTKEGSQSNKTGRITYCELHGFFGQAIKPICIQRLAKRLKNEG